ncbi:MAG: TGS domain-containing protein [Candidatus Falkowbacteria bacterium]|nr:TGS domain-containing protein [Candidatus Falkowbacteria bacterium]
MHEEALYGIAAHWYYKQKEGDDYREEKQPAWVKEILNILRQENEKDDFIKEVKLDIFRNRIFVFSPKGDVFDLPEDSSPIDFAYAVHTEIGNKATGALVNNKMVALDHPLKNGDVVEIIIEKQRKSPSRDWLKFVKTNRAKEKITHFTKESRFEQFKKILPKIK